MNEARLRSVVALTYADHTDAARTVALKAAALDLELWEAARRAFALANARRLAVRSVSLTLDRIIEAETQLDLWSMEEEEESDSAPAPAPASRDSAAASHALQHALDRITTRYGARALTTGAVRALTR